MLSGRVIFNLLSNDPGVQPLCTQVFPNIAPQESAPPSLVVRGGEAKIDKTLAKTGKLVWEMIEVACLHMTEAGSVNLAMAVRNALVDKKGLIAGFRVAKICYVGMQDTEEALPGAGQQRIIKIKTVELKVWLYLP